MTTVAPKSKPARDDASPHRAVAAQPQTDAPEALSPFEGLQLGRIVWFRDAGFDFAAIVTRIQRDNETDLPTGVIHLTWFDPDGPPRTNRDTEYDPQARDMTWRWPTVPVRTPIAS